MGSILKRLVVAGVLAQGAVLLGSAVQGALRAHRFKKASFPYTPPTRSRIRDDVVTVFNHGADLYDEMLAAIGNAEHRIYFETFIWKGDDVGVSFKSALTAAAERGVEVFVIYDAFANLVVPHRFKRFDAALNVIAYPVFPAGWRFYDPRRYGRDHHKILCVDDRVGFIGGYNIGSPYARHWRDTHLAMDGPSTWHLSHAFVLSWNRNRREAQPRLAQEGSPTWESRIRVYRNAPRERRFPIRDMYLQALSRAKHRIYLSHSYLVPDRDVRGALMDAAARGVDVQVLIPARSNHPVMDWLAQRFFAELLEGGVRIFLYEDAMIHNKTATVDGKWLTIGTANIDRMSMTGNYEVNVEIFDATLARSLEETFSRDRTQARELTLDEWHRRAATTRVLDRAVGPLRYLL